MENIFHFREKLEKAHSAITTLLIILIIYIFTLHFLLPFGFVPQFRGIIFIFLFFWLGLGILLYLLKREYAYRNLGDSLQNPVAILMFLFAIIFLYRIRHVEDIFILAAQHYIICFLIFYLCLLSWRKKFNIEEITFFLILLCAVQSILGVLESASWYFGITAREDKLFWQRFLFYFHDGYQFNRNILRASGTFGSPNTFGYFLSFCIPLIICFTLIQKNKIIKYTSWLVLFITLMALLATYSRQAWISTILTLLFLFYLLNKKKIVIFHLKPKLLIPLSITGLIFLVILFPGVLLRLQSIFNFYDRSIQNRLILFQSSIEMLLDYPLTGIGLGRFHEIYPKFYRPHNLAENFPNAHQTFIDIGLMTGIFGLFIYILIFYIALRYSINNFLNQDNNNQSILTLGWAAGIISYLIIGFSDEASIFLTPLLLSFLGLAIIILQNKEYRPKLLCSYRTIIILYVLGILSLWFNPPTYADIYHNRLNKIVQGFRGKIGIAIKNLNTQEMILINEKELFPAASVIKLPVLAELYYQISENRINLDDKIYIQKEDLASGSGIIRKMELRQPVTINNLAELMMIVSDGTAYNLLLDKLGIENINQRMELLGLENTQILGKIQSIHKRVRVNPLDYRYAEESVNSRKFGIGYTTPYDMMLLLEKIAKRELINPEFSKQMENILINNINNERIPRWLTHAEIAHKTGSLTRSRHDAGYVISPRANFIIVILTDNIRDIRWSPDNEAVITIATIAQYTFHYFTKYR